MEEDEDEDEEEGWKNRHTVGRREKKKMEIRKRGVGRETCVAYGV